MLQFLMAFTVFIGLHSIPAIPRIRTTLVSRLGHGIYIAIYSGISVLALAWLFHAALSLDYVELWYPKAWQGIVTFLAAPLGLFLVIGGLLSRNPFSTTARRGKGAPGAIVTITRHPVLWGFLLWALGHIPPNGDSRSVILFGGFALFSAGAMLMFERRSRRNLGKDWSMLSQKTSVIPLGAVLTGRGRLEFDLAMGAALAGSTIVVGWLLFGGHLLLFKADPIYFLMASLAAA